MIFNLIVKNQELSFTDSEDTTRVAETQGYIECDFEFSTEDWNETIKTAYFENARTGAITSQLLENDKCLIPHEALTDEGYVKFSVVGEKEGYRITSNIVQFFNRPTVYGGEPSDPTPDQYEQIIPAAAAAQSAAEDALNTANEVKQQAESGEFDGAQGPPGEQGEKGDPGDSIFTKINAGIETDPTVITEPGAYYVLTDGFVQVSPAGARSADISPNDPIAVVADTILLYGNVGSDSSMFITAINGNYTVYRNVAGKVQSYSFNDLVYYDPETGDPVTMQILCETLTTISELIFPAMQPPAETGQLVTVGERDEQSGIFKLAARNADSQLSDTSTFPVQNKVVKEAVDTLNEKILSSAHIVTSVVSSNVTLNNNTEYRLQTVEALNLSLPTSISDDYESYLVFESGETATVLSYAADSIKFIGDDCDDEGDFIPQTNKGYEVNLKNLGYNRIIARVGAF